MENIQVSSYNKNGYCIVRNLLETKQLKQLNKRINNFFKNTSNKLKGKDINFTQNKINSIHDIDKFDSYFKRISKNKKILKIVKKIINAKVEFRKSEIFAKPAKFGLPSPFHQDNFYWAVKNNNALTVWLALDKSNKRNGGVTYFKGSHKFGIVRHIDSNAPGSSQKIDKRVLKKYNFLKKVTPSLNPGDALIHHCLTFHGSSVNSTRKNRLGFTMQFKDKNATYDKKQLQYYKKKLQKQILKRKKDKFL